MRARTSRRNACGSRSRSCMRTTCVRRSKPNNWKAAHAAQHEVRRLELTLGTQRSSVNAILPTDQRGSRQNHAPLAVPSEERRASARAATSRSGASQSAALVAAAASSSAAARKIVVAL